jgi:hypothetical protein
VALTREEILGREDLPLEEVPVPEWGGAVWVRTISAAERDAWEASTYGDGKGDVRERLANLRARLVCLCACSANGDRLFTDADAGKLGGKSAAAVDRLFDVAQRLNGLGPRDVEELVKN